MGTDCVFLREIKFARSLALGCSGVLAISLTAGCQQGPLQARRQAMMEQQQQQQAAQHNDYQRRAEQLDENNRNLHAQLAQSQRQAELLRDEVQLLRGRLGETADMLAETEVARLNAEDQLSSNQQSAQRRGGAMITANNSQLSDLPVIDVPGVDVQRDGDVVRIELPSDRLFLPGTATVHRGALGLVDQVSEAVLRHYPRQRIGVEGHTDSEPPIHPQWSNHHQLATAQAMAVFEQISRRHRISPRQLFVLGHGPNHPRVSNATLSGRAKNRRVELVVYPETVGP